MNTRLAMTISVAALSLAFAGACKRQPEPSSTQTTSAATETQEEGRMTATEHPAAAPTTATTTAMMSKEDKEFMTKAANGGMFEVTLGAEAARKAMNADVKAFANRMVTDHGKVNDELKQLAAKKGVTLPTELDKKHKDKIAELSKASGAKFDKDYIELMVEDHEKDVKDFKDAAKDAKDPDLRGWAAKTVPTLDEHLNLAKEIKTKTHPRT